MQIRRCSRVVIFNSRPGEANVSMQLDDTAIAIPSVFIPLEFGEALALTHIRLRSITKQIFALTQKQVFFQIFQVGVYQRMAS